MDSWQDLPLEAKAQVRSANLDLKNLALKKTKPFSPESQPDTGTYLEVKCNQPKHLHKAKKERRGQGVRISSGTEPTKNGAWTAVLGQSKKYQGSSGIEPRKRWRLDAAESALGQSKKGEGSSGTEPSKSAAWTA